MCPNTSTVPRVGLACAPESHSESHSGTLSFEPFFQGCKRGRGAPVVLFGAPIRPALFQSTQLDSCRESDERRVMSLRMFVYACVRDLTETLRQRLIVMYIISHHITVFSLYRLPAALQGSQPKPEQRKRINTQPTMTGPRQILPRFG